MARTLGEFEQLVLLALLDLREDDAYGVPIRDSIERRTGRRVSIGAVYTALDRLETRGLVSSRFGEPTAERGGRRKRLYRLEPLGARMLAESIRVLRDMSRGLLQRLELEAAGDRGAARGSVKFPRFSGHLQRLDRDSRLEVENDQARTEGV